MAGVFDRGDVTYTRIYDMADIFADPQYAARGMLAKVPDEELGEVTVPAPVPRLSARRDDPQKRWPHRARHGAGAERAGRLTRAEIARLEQENVVYAPGGGPQIGGPRVQE